MTDEVTIPNKLLVKIRAEATSRSRNINAKFQAPYTVPNYTKFVMATNNVDNFAKIEQEENRYFVLNVKPLPEGTEIADFQERIEKELPYFIDYLSNHHDLVTLNETRSWFNYNDIKTPALQRVVNNSKSKVNMLIEEVLEDLYETVSVDKSDDYTIEFSLSQISKEVGLDKGEEKEIKEALKNLGVQVSERKERFACIFKGDKTNAFRYSISVGDLAKNWESYEPQAPITLRKLKEYVHSHHQN